MAGLRLDLGKVDQDLKAELEKEDQQQQDQQQQDTVGEEMDPLSNNEEQMSSLEKIEKFCQSDSIMERDIAIRSVVEASYIVSSYSEFESILDIVYPMASDHEPMIRVGVLGTITTLMERNSEFREQEETPFGEENEDRLYEIPIKMLNDYNQQVRRVSHNCIVSLLDEPRGSIDGLIRQLCPMIKRCLGKEENYDLRMDTALLISRVSPLIDAELCRTHFVPLLSALAIDNMFHVRKAFAMCCRDFCPSVGEECTERDILPSFLKLCKDEVWGVRKACADVFMDISASCSLTSRHDNLTPAFLQLLRDDSRWVRKAAFQSLGPFISTFHGRHCDSTNNIDNTATTSNSSSFNPIGDSELDNSSFLQSSDTSLESRDQPVATVTNHDSDLSTLPNNHTHSDNPSISNTDTKSLEHRNESLQNEYSLFQFWRQPIPRLLVEAVPDSNSTKPDSYTTGKNKNRSVMSNIDNIMYSRTRRTGDYVTSDGSGGDDGDMIIPDEEDDMNGDNSVFRDGEGCDGDDYRGDLTDIKDELLAESAGMEVGEDKGSQAYSEGVGFIDSANHSHLQSTSGQVHEEDLVSGLNTIDKSVAMEMTSVENLTSSEAFAVPEHKQEIVPEELIDMYLSMTDAAKAQSIDAELPFYCAFSFPAVLQTLGSKNWLLLKPTFEALASDMQWKIRRVLAFSLHEIALILGREKTVSDLLCIVDEYCTKDLDDVKYGVLTHLADFFEVIPNDVRRDSLPDILTGLLDTENERNWRYRNLLTEQLTAICEQCDCRFVSQHIAPVAIKMSCDRVAQVRVTALTLMATVLSKLDHSTPKLCNQMLIEIRNQFSGHTRWLLRLLYIKLCQLIYQKKMVNLSMFAVECIPSILKLSKDPVPNVRMAVGKLLNDAINQTEHLLALNSHFSSDIQQALDTLQSDGDRDVRLFSGASLSQEDFLTPHATPHHITDSSCDSDNVFFSHETTSGKIDLNRAADLLKKCS